MSSYMKTKEIKANLILAGWKVLPNYGESILNKNTQYLSFQQQQPIVYLYEKRLFNNPKQKININVVLDVIHGQEWTSS